MTPRALDRRLALWTGAVLAVLAAVLLFAREYWSIPVTRNLVGIPISDTGFAIQLAAMLGGIVLVNVSSGAAARWWLAAGGAVCLLAYGFVGACFVLALVVWWRTIELRALGRLRFALAALLLVALNACAWAARELAQSAWLFSATFTLRLIVHGYDRWQTDEPTELVDFLAFALPAPLVVVPPYMAIIPLFGGFDTRFTPGLTPDRLRRIARHFALAIAWGGSLAALEASGIRDEIAQPAAMYVKFLGNILGFAVVVHIAFPLLLLHGIEERLAIDRPFLATRFVELWRRTSIHLKDAQVFLFYTPALLAQRRRNRYLAIVLATAWTMIVGNTLLHMVVRYCFLPDTMARIGSALLANTLMAVALAIDLCHDEWRHRRGAPAARTLPQRVLGWLVTMTIASTAAWL